MDDIEATILSSIETHTEMRPKLTDELALLNFDSLAMAETAHDIEQKLRIRLDDRLLDQRTVGELVQYVRQLRVAQVGGAEKAL